MTISTRPQWCIEPLRPHLLGGVFGQLRSRRGWTRVDDRCRNASQRRTYPNRPPPPRPETRHASSSLTSGGSALSRGSPPHRLRRHRGPARSRPGCAATSPATARSARGPAARGPRSRGSLWSARGSVRESPSSCLFCSSSSCTVLHCWSAMTCRLASARFWLIITNVERKIASSETIIVSRPNGYFSTPNPIQHPNQTM